MLDIPGGLSMPRYAPTRPAVLALQKVRASIIAFVRRRPGASVTQICKETGISWGTAQHHLHILQIGGFTKSLSFGRTRMTFPSDFNDSRLEIIAALRDAPVKELARAVLEGPGRMQVELCQLLGFTRKMFRHRVDVLIAAGLVNEELGAKIRRYEPSEFFLKAGPSLLDDKNLIFDASPSDDSTGPPKDTQGRPETAAG